MASPVARFCEQLLKGTLRGSGPRGGGGGDAGLGLWLLWRFFFSLGQAGNLRGAQQEGFPGLEQTRRLGQFTLA